MTHSTDQVPATAAATDAAASPLRRGAALRGWLSGGTIYAGAVMGRSSLGIASIAATRRFGLSPAQLSVFVILQLGIYAVMQVPTGLLVDRFGSRRLLVVAAALMGSAGFIFAFAPNYPVAVLARAMLGFGDAMTFISVLRFAATNFSRRRFPQVVALTSMFAYTGTILATVPLALLLHSAGWQITFSVVALVPVVGAVAALITVPPQLPNAAAATGARATVRATLADVRLAWRTPGTRLGFWIHFSTMGMANAFGSLWGLPFMVAIGLSKSHAGYLLLLSVLVGLVMTLSCGAVLVRRPALRVPLAVLTCLALLLAWVPFLIFGGNHPSSAVVIALVIVLAGGGPVSSIAFMLVRDYNRPKITGTATGVVNGAGFVSTIVCAAIIGAALELSGNTGPGAFRVAYLIALAVPAFGVVRILVWWRRVRADVLQLAEQGHAVPVLVVRRRWDTATGAIEAPFAGAKGAAALDLAQ